MRASGTISAQRLHAAATTHWALIPLVAGVLIGMAFSTVLLVQPHRATITNVYLELPSEREDATSRLRDLRRMLNDVGASRHSGVEKLAEEVSVRAPVYYAVVMSHRHSSEWLKVLRSTWAKDIAWERVGYFVPLEDEPQLVEGGTEEGEDVHYGEIQSSDADPMAVVELPNTHPDFYMDVISHVCKTKLNETKWFFLGGDDVYIKPQALEAHLQHYENALSVGYLGRPASVKGSTNTVCLKGPGTILSHSVLVELCSKLDTCSDGGGEGGTVGRCITEQLQHGCNTQETKVIN